MIHKLKTFLENKNIPFESNICLKKKTWIHRGGMCSLFITPTNSDDLSFIIQFLYKENIKFLLVGHTSNLYILNECNIPVVVSTSKCNQYHITENSIICESGAGVSRMAKEMSKQGIAGFEYLHELPGTVGAAIYNNSSCYSNSITALLISAEVVTEDGEIKIMKPEDFDFKFRTSIMKEKRFNGVIIKATLKLERGDASQFEKFAQKTKESRNKNLEGNAKNLGCTVNRCFINGKMPFKYLLPFKIYNTFLRLTEKDKDTRKSKSKYFICKISGYSNIAKYISDKNMIVYMWLDEGADAAFPDYLEFMRKVYKTDKIEIEVIK